MILFGIIVTQMCNCERNVKKNTMHKLCALVVIPDREQLCVCVCVCICMYGCYARDTA